MVICESKSQINGIKSIQPVVARGREESCDGVGDEDGDEDGDDVRDLTRHLEHDHTAQIAIS